MKNTITITSKGQTTLPAAIRQKLGLDKTGGVLKFTYNEATNELVISKVMTIEELSERTTRLIKPGLKPLLNVDEYYQKHRRVRP